MNSTLMRWGMGVMLRASLVIAACWAGSAPGATIRETYVLAPSGEQATFDPTPGVVRSIVENGVGGQSVTLAFKAYPDRDRQIVNMVVYVAHSVQRDVTFEYHHPLAIKGRPEKPGSEVWALPQDADRRPVFELSDQNIAAPTKIYVYVLEKDRDGKSYSTLVETRYAALHAAFVDNR